jgi:hypothetical protein
MQISDASSGSGQRDDSARVGGWSGKPDVAISDAIHRYGLSRVGWRGFHKLPWVKATVEKYPLAAEIASSASSHKPDDYRKSLGKLLRDVEPEDFAAVQSWFVGKLALEELSCRMNGSGAGACDKRAAYMDIFEMLKEHA